MQAYVALLAVPGVAFSEVVQKHPAAATCFRCRIFGHGLHVLNVAVFPLFIRFLGYHEAVGVHTFLGESDVGSFFARDVFYDAQPVELQQTFVDLLWGESDEMSQKRFVDIGIVGKQAGITSQQG